VGRQFHCGAGATSCSRSMASGVPQLSSHRKLASCRGWLPRRNRGATLMFANLHEWHAPSQRLCRSLAERLSTKVTAAIFYTPAGHHGLKVHRDDSHVIVVQLAGTKLWSLHDTPKAPEDWAGGGRPPPAPLTGAHARRGSGARHQPGAADGACARQLLSDSLARAHSLQQRLRWTERDVRTPPRKQPRCALMEGQRQAGPGAAVPLRSTRSVGAGAFALVTSFITSAI
jgi:hypothetical protein